MGKISAKDLGIRLIIITIIGLLSLTTYFVVTSYNTYIQTAESGILSKLEAIAKTSALHIDGNEHQNLVTKFNTKNAITTSHENTLYASIHEVISNAQKANNVGTDIYTLFYDSLNAELGKGTFSFGVSSGQNPYYRHSYDSYPQLLLDNYEVGAKIPAYGDEHGMWLSAFAPIKNDEGKVVAVVQVDQKFDDFIMAARKEAIKELIVSLLVFIVLTGIILYIIRQIIIEDKKNKAALATAYSKVEKQHKSIKDSINYAKRIQNSIVPNEQGIKDVFNDSFMMYRPKDVVSGDFPWMFKKDNSIYIAAVDCTGHGVPGAMMSFIGYFLLNEINGHTGALPPATILDKLHAGVVSTLRQDEEGSQSKDGMDVALCKIDLTTNEVQYAGAHRPLFYMNNNGLEEFKGDRKAIGGKVNPKKDKPFTNYTVNANTGEAIYFFSDGLPDQFGGDGPKEKKFSPKTIRNIVKDNHGKSMLEIKNVFDTDFDKWQGKTPQTDDVLLIGIKF